MLRANPLGLLSIIYDYRTQSWETWVTRLWLEVNEIESLTRSAPPDWLMKDPALYQQVSNSRVLMPQEPPLELRNFAPMPFDELSKFDKLLPRLYTTDTEISHGQNAMAFAIRYANFCLEAVSAVDSARQSNGFPSLAPGAKAVVEDRIRFTQSRCYSLQDRFTEIRERHRSQINAVSIRNGPKPTCSVVNTSTVHEVVQSHCTARKQNILGCCPFGCY